MISRRPGAKLKRWDALLTQERLRVYPSVVIFMFALFWVLQVAGNPSSMLPDFRARWTAGTMVVTGRALDLYDPVAQSVIQRSHGAQSLSWFVSPPPVAVLFTPLGALPYALAALLWLAVSVTGSVVTVRLLRPYWPARWGPYWVAVLITVASQPTLELIGDGQDSWLLLFAGVAAFRLWQARKPWWAGATLTLGLLVKPQLMLAALVLVAVYGGIRMTGGLILGTAGCVLLSLLVLGPPVWIDWIHAVFSSTFADQVTLGQSYKAASLQGFVMAVSPPGAERVAASIGLAAGLLLLAAWVAWLIRNRPPQWMVLSTAAFVTVLAAPHAMVYDLVIVLPAVATFVRQEPRPVIRLAAGAGFVIVWLGPTLSFARSAPWPFSALSAQWVVLVPLFLSIRLMTTGSPVPSERKKSRCLGGPLEFLDPEMQGEVGNP